MRLFSIRPAFSLIACSLAASPALAQDLKIRDIAVIPIHAGVNTVDRFAPDGRSATIVRAWRDNGNAHGHIVYLVTMARPDCGGGDKACVVDVDDGQTPLQDTIGASPFDGERVLQAVRFAHATVDGAPATVMIRADLGEAKSGVLADHAPAGISLYVLRSPGIEVGTTPDVFKLAFKVRAVGTFCNADMALHVAMGLSLPTDYAGGKGPGGCID